MITLKHGSSARWDMFGRIQPKLGIVFYEFCKELEHTGIKDITVTSIIRPKENDSGLHALGRAIDIRCDFDDDIGDQIMQFLNNRYVYDMNRLHIKTIIKHVGIGYGRDVGKHYHLQVSS